MVGIIFRISSLTLVILAHIARGLTHAWLRYFRTEVETLKPYILTIRRLTKAMQRLSKLLCNIQRIIAAYALDQRIMLSARHNKPRENSPA
jgi:hypothetical protein